MLDLQATNKCDIDWYVSSGSPSSPSLIQAMPKTRQEYSRQSVPYAAVKILEGDEKHTHSIKTVQWA